MNISMISKEHMTYGHCYCKSKDCWPISNSFLLLFHRRSGMSLVVIALLFLSTATPGTVALHNSVVKDRNLSSITEDKCADDSFFTFPIDGDDGLVGSCLDIAGNSTYITNYCDRMDIKYACPATCLESQNIPCVCPEDNTEFLFTLKIGATRPCDWLTRNSDPEVIGKRRSNYCYNKEYEEYTSVRENCVVSCGFCTGTFLAPSTSPSMLPTSVPSSAPSHIPSESVKPSQSQFPSVAPTLSSVPSISSAPSFVNWREIPYEPYMPSPDSTTNNITLDDDMVSGLIDIGFAFDWFGNPIDQLRISSNGLLIFNASDDSDHCCDADPIGSTGMARIALVQEDLDPSDSIEGSISVSRNSNPLSFKVTFKNIRFYGRRGGSRDTFVQASVSLFPGGDVIFCYGQGIMNSKSFVAGIEDPVGGAYALPFQPFNASTGVTDVWPTEKCWQFLAPYGGSPSASPSTIPPSGNPTECIDEPTWMTSSNGLTCSQIEHLIFVESIGTILEGFDYCLKLSGVIWDGKSIQEACCVCGGSAFQNVAPSVSPSISTVPTFYPSESPTDCIDEPGWEIHGGITCEDIKNHNNVIGSYSWCEIFGNAFHNEKTANEACCTCGGSDYHI